MKIFFVLAAGVLALMGAGSAYALRNHASKMIRPGHCTLVRGRRVCAKLEQPSTETVTVTTTQTVSVPTTVTVTRTVAPPSPSPLAVAYEQVRREVAWAMHWNAPYSYGRLVAQAALDYTLGHVSPGAYGYLLMTSSPMAPVTPDGILGAQAGICGHASLVFAAIVHHFGLSVRRVNFYYTNWLGQPGGHTTDEVYYDGDWHFFDPMYGLYYQDPNGNPLSISEARANPGSVTEQRDVVSFANLIDTYRESFELDPATSVEYVSTPGIWGG